jgi:hypothetical protein
MKLAKSLASKKPKNYWTPSMPYIDRTSRDKFTEPIKALWDSITTEGELNYVMTKLALNFVSKQGGDSYANLAKALAAFEAAKLEFYRRKMAPYENTKSLQNGDVY